MLNKASFEVLPFVSKEESRYALHSVLVTPEATIATDGHALAWISAPGQKCENFPVVPGEGNYVDTFEPFLLPVAVAKKIDAAIPTGKAMGNLPILGHAALRLSGESKAFVTTDMDNHQAFTWKQPDGKFPDYKAAIPDPRKRKAFVSIDAALLERACKAAKDLRRNDPGPSTIQISVFGETDAIRIDCYSPDNNQALTCVVMPVRDSGDVRNSYGWSEREEERIGFVMAWDDAHREDEQRTEAIRESIRLAVPKAPEPEPIPQAVIEFPLPVSSTGEGMSA